MSRCRTRPACPASSWRCRIRSPTRRPAEFKAMVERGKEYIAAGDVFQVVLSQRFSAPFTLPPFALYRALRRTNPSPFLFHLDFGGFALVGSSPEILVRVRDGEVTIRPLAGTRRRGATPEEDQALEAGAAGRSQGARRAPDAARPRPQRRRPRREIGTVRVTEQLRHRTLQPCHAHRQPRGGPARREARRHRRADGGLPGRHALRRAQGARDGDHRRAGEGKARTLRRAASAISPPTARWTPASCCAPRWSRTA